MIKAVLFFLASSLFCCRAVAQTASWPTGLIDASQARTAGRIGRATEQRQTTTGSFRLVQRLQQVYRANAWKDTTRDVSSQFTSSNLPSLIERETSPNGGSSWQPYLHDRRRYTAFGELLTDTTLYYSNGSFRVVGAFVNTFTVSNKLEQTTMRDLSSGIWRSSRRYTYTYDAQDRPVQWLQEYASTYTGNMLNYARSIYTYNAQNQVVVEDVQYYNSAIAMWSTDERYLTTYTAAGHVAVVTGQIDEHNGVGFHDWNQVTYTYNPQNPDQVVQMRRFFWTGSFIWTLINQTLFTYDPDGNLSTETFQMAGPTGYSNVYRYVYSYQNVLAVADRQLRAGLSLFPNPASVDGAIEVQFSLAQPAPATLQVLDALSRTKISLTLPSRGVSRQHLTAKELGLSAGLYVVRLTSQGKSEQIKLLVK